MHSCLTKRAIYLKSHTRAPSKSDFPVLFSVQGTLLLYFYLPRNLALIIYSSDLT